MYPVILLLNITIVCLICQGEEVMNTYGKLSNTSLLHTYGFTEDDNPHDEVNLLLLVSGFALMPSTVLMMLRICRLLFLVLI